MKKYTILLATIILAFAACNKETPAPEMPDAPDAPHGAVPFTFHATVGELTKTEISENADGSAAVLWKATDKVSVFDAAGNNCEFSVSGAGSTATLSGELVPSSSGRYYAVYPYAPSSTLSGTTVTAEIPSVQKVSGPGFADGAVVSAAEVSEEAATFCNLASLVRFTVPEDVTTLRSVTLASTAPLSGALVMDFAGGSPAVTSVPDHATTVTVEMEDGSALPSGNYYVAVLPGSHKLTVTLTDLDGMTAERAMDEAREFASSHIRGIGSVKADTFDNVEFVLGDAAFTGETKTLIMSAKVPAGTYTMEQLLGVTSYQYKGDKAIYVIDNLSFTVGSTTEKQTISVAKSDLTARHLLVREGDDLQAVLDAAEAGLDDVYVGAGTFTGGFTMAEDINVTGSWNNDFTQTIDYQPLRSTEGLTTILDASGDGAVLTQEDVFTTETVWKNLSLRNGRVTTTDTHGCVRLKAGGVLEGCEVAFNINVEPGNCGGGIYADQGSRVVRCWIHDNGGSRGGGCFTRGDLAYSLIEKNIAEESGRGGGISVFGGNDKDHRARIWNCIIRDNSGGEGGGIHLERYATVYNCLVTGNKASVNVGGIQTYGPNGCNIINCTVVGNEDSSSSAYASGICCSEHGVLMNNVVYGNFSAAHSSAEATQIIVNNKYLFFFNNAFPEGLLLQKVSPWKAERHDDASNVALKAADVSENYAPAAGSNLIDKGLEELSVTGHEDGVVPDWTDMDLAGGTRRIRAIDIGCYEYPL